MVCRSGGVSPSVQRKSAYKEGRFPVGPLKTVVRPAVTGRGAYEVTGSREIVVRVVLLRWPVSARGTVTVREKRGGRSLSPYQLGIVNTGTWWLVYKFFGGQAMDQ